MIDAVATRPDETTATVTAVRLPALPRITRARGRGRLHFILVPGLVPDGPETFLRQAGLLKAFGSTATVTYPYHGFDLDAVLATIAAEVVSAERMGSRPVIVAVSVGAALTLELLRRRAEQSDELPLAALVLISPLTCVDDLSASLRRLLDPIRAESIRDGGRPELALERGRAFFRALAERSVPAKPSQGLRRITDYLTPSGLQRMGEDRIRARIGRTLDAIPPCGGVERVLALGELRGLPDGRRRPLTTAPTLVLWGSKERHTLDMDGPGTRVLCRPDLASRLMPGVEVQWVYGPDGGEVPHASLLRHAAAFNPLLARFLKRVRNRPPVPTAASA